MDKGGFVSTGVSSDVTLATDIVFTPHDYGFVVLINEPYVYAVGHSFSYAPPRLAFKFNGGIRILPLRTHVVAEHKPAKESTYEGGNYLNCFHKSNSIKEAGL